ncbi:GGDEF domain-containing protein [Alteromonas facilis]|uniref:GGDEF domain-containing protein n=1 Tax=Alteromonas facilis TaxID=2048004 RepID=UPI000C28CE07|nr:GGDEF domain-containing protein [Alteromonas facilis]
MRTASSSDLVGHIAGFTSLRDVDLLEVSLLKSIHTTLRPLNVSLISLDSNNIILKKVSFSADNLSNVVLKTPADEQLLRASEQLDWSNKEYCTVSVGDSCLTLFLLSQNRRISQYVCIESKGNIVTQTDSYQIIGMLRVFQNFRALLTESQTDELTGLPNRKAFTNISEKINESIVASPESYEGNARRALDDNPTYWLALADLDNFKNINDNFGHLMGDEVLVRAAQTIQSSIRETDLVFRYGGEEFAILINAASKEDVDAVLERVRANIESIDFHKLGRMTISIGFTEMKEDTFTLHIIEAADRALYHSKEKGKNKVSFASSKQTPKSSDIESDIELF